MIDLAAHALVIGGCLVALALAAFFFAAAIGEAIDTCREARDTAAEAKARHALYPAPDVEARGTVIEVEPLLDRLEPIDEDAITVRLIRGYTADAAANEAPEAQPWNLGMVGGDGFRNR